MIHPSRNDQLTRIASTLVEAQSWTPGHDGHGGATEQTCDQFLLPTRTITLTNTRSLNISYLIISTEMHAMQYTVI